MNTKENTTQLLAQLNQFTRRVHQEDEVFLFDVHLCDNEIDRDGERFSLEALEELKKVGYTGYVSDEYEKYWYPAELPEPEIGMKHNLEYAKKFLLEK